MTAKRTRFSRPGALSAAIAAPSMFMDIAVIPPSDGTAGRWRSYAATAEIDDEVKAGYVKGRVKSGFCPGG